MTTAEKRGMLKWNTILWLAAMALPGILKIVFADAKFPWPLILPLILVGPLLASNSMLSKAIGTTTDEKK